MTATAELPHWSKTELARRVAADIRDGAFVNLGIGLPTLVADFVEGDREVVFHSENGILGVGPKPAGGNEDWDLVNAGKEPVTLIPGSAIMSHAESFALIRGGHLDLAIMGALQVSASGDLANWSSGDDAVPAVGGAMDLASGARQVWIMMHLLTSRGEPKLVRECSYPLTAAGVVRRLYSDLGVFAFTANGLVFEEGPPGSSAEALQDVLQLPLLTSPGLAATEVAR